MSQQNKRSLGPIVLCLALLFAMKPLVGAENSLPLPFLKVGRTYYLTHSVPNLPNRVKILGEVPGTQWFQVQQEIPGMGGFSAADPKGSVKVQPPIINKLWINFATISGVRPEDEEPEPAPEKK